MAFRSKSNKAIPVWLALISATTAQADSLQDLLQESAANLEENDELAPPGQQSSVVMASETTPICEAFAVSQWNQTWDVGQGVDASDPEGSRLSNIAAVRRYVGKNWYPVDGYKHTVCGVLHHFNFYDPWSSGDEADWNNFIIPAEAYQHFITEILPLGDLEHWHDCGRIGNCLEGEITPDESFYRNPWFDRRYGDEDDSSPLEGRGLCTYGPWVYEEAHGNRPEIHPSEMYWWRDQVAVGPFTLMLLQDDSNRFDSDDNFETVSGPATFPGWWRPWSAAPRTGVFRIAFELNPNRDGLAFRIFDRAAQRNVVTNQYPDARQDADDGRNHGIIYDGRAVIAVLEQQQNDSDVGVTFSDVCRSEDNSRVQGYIALTAMVGSGSRGDEGYMVLGAEQLPPDEILLADSPPMLRSGGFSVRPAIVRDSLRRVIIDGEAELVADIRLRNNPGVAGEARPIMRQARLITEAGAEVFAFRASENSDDLGVVEAVPVLGQASIEIITADGQTISHSMPGVALAPEVFVTSSLGEVDTNLWPVFIRAAGGASSERPLVDLRRVSRWSLTVSPTYVPLRDGRPAREDDSPVVEELTEVALDGPPARRAELFGEQQPFGVTWSFRARDLATGTEVRVSQPDEPVVGAPVRVRNIVSDQTGARVEVDFPRAEAGGLYEVTAEVTFTDSLGMEGSLQIKIWSHGISGAAETVDYVGRAVDLALASANNSRTAAFDVAAADILQNFTDPDRDDAEHRRARIVYLAAARALEDAIINVEELGGLIELAEGFAD